MNNVKYEAIDSVQRTAWNNGFGILNNPIRVMLLDRVKWTVHGYVDRAVAHQVNKKVWERVKDD